MIYAVIFLLAQTTPHADVAAMRAAKDDFRSCVIEKTLAIGKASTEDAATIERAVASMCRDEEKTLLRSYARAPISDFRVAALVERDREEAREDATAALIQARLK